jgi:hypothetical protein
MAHLKYSFKALCELIAEYFGIEEEIKIENGPAEQLERQTARAELTSLATMLDNPVDRKRAIVAIASTMNDNEFVSPFIQAITTEDPALTQLKEQATQMQQSYEQQIADLKNQITLLKCQAIESDTRNKYTIDKAQLDNATKIYIEEMKQNNENQRQDKDLIHDDVNRVNEIQTKLDFGEV